MHCRLQDRQLNPPPDAQTYRALLCLWLYLLREYPNSSPDTLDAMALDIITAVSDLPVTRLRRLSHLAKEMSVASRRAAVRAFT